MENIVETYKGFTICKPKQDSYMRRNKIVFLAYDREENLFDGAATLEEMRRKIDLQVE